MNAPRKWLFPGMLASLLLCSALGAQEPNSAAAAADSSIKDLISRLDRLLQKLENDKTAETLADISAKIDNLRPRQAVTESPPAPTPGTTTPAPAAGAPPAAAQPAAPAVEPIVPADFWTVQSAKDLNIYQLEDKIEEATQLLSKHFGQAAEKAEAVAEAELKTLADTQRALFLEELSHTSRTKDTMAYWRGAWNSWFKHVIEKLVKAKTRVEYRTILVQAFHEGATESIEWGKKIEKAHDEARGGAAGGAASGTGGGAAVASSGYLPPHQAAKQARFYRRATRLQGHLYALKAR